MYHPTTDDRTHTIDNIKHLLKDIDEKNKILDFHHYLLELKEGIEKKITYCKHYLNDLLDLINPYPITLLYNGGELDIDPFMEFQYSRWGENFDFSPKYLIEHVIVASSVKSLPKFIFKDCLRLKTVTFQQETSLTTISEQAFYLCVSLNNIIIPSSVTKIEDKVFCFCLTLNNIFLPNSITSIGASVFKNNITLSQITLPTSLRIIPTYTFANCWALISIVLPSCLTKIEDYAFQNCKLMRNIAFPKGLEYIISYAFKDCSSLQFVHFKNTRILNHGYRFNRDDDRFCTFTKNVIFLVDSYSRIVDDCFNGIVNDDGEVHSVLDVLYVNNRVQLEPIFNLSSVDTMLNSIPEKIPMEQQMNVLQQIFHRSFPIVAKIACDRGINLLHILTQYPSSRSARLMERLLEKCPTAAMSVDNDGLSPLYHLLAFNTKSDQSVIRTLLKYCDNSVLNQALSSRETSSHVIKLIAMFKFESLSEVDAESGLLPFMICSQKENYHDLTLTYELIKLKPDILLQTGIKFY